MKKNHVHDYRAKRKNPTVLVCDCGRFQHVNFDPKDIITEQRPSQRASLPWSYQSDDKNGFFQIISPARNPNITHVVAPLIDNEENAAFIVLAVNAHEELLARVRLDGNAYHNSHSYEKGVRPFRDCIHPECFEYRRIIAKAEGK